MKTLAYLTLIALIVVALLLAGCGYSPIPEEVVVTRVVETEGETVIEEVMITATPGAISGANLIGDHTSNTLPYNQTRLIVKNAELRLLVADTDVAIDRVNQITADTGGYILSARVRYDEWLGENYKYASITIGVPVDRFELAMRRLRHMAVRVVDESASGQDVTNEYVDLQSRLSNLEATRDRIREFLDQAQTVEESLQVNEQLSAIEGQIELVQGRMNYLSDRSTYSTITIQIDPDLPQPTPTPTPTPTPPWTPAETVEQAGNTIGAIARTLIELAIWFAIVVVPLLAPLALIAWIVSRWTRRRVER